MEIIAAILLAGPLGYFVRGSRAALLLYLAAWAVIFPIQTVVVSRAGDLDWSYWPLNAVILAAGIGLNRLGRRIRRRRQTVASVPSV
jgi:hypothetical protein